MRRNPLDIGRKIPPEHRKIYQKYGTNPPLHIKDGETGDVLYTDKDLVSTAKFSAERGGRTAGFPSMELDKLVEKFWQKDVTCKKCGNHYFHFLNSVYKDGWRCFSCFTDNEVYEIPAELKDLIEFTYEYINKYLEFKVNDNTNRSKVMEKYLDAFKGEEE